MPGREGFEVFRELGLSFRPTSSRLEDNLGDVGRLTGWIETTHEVGDHQWTLWRVRGPGPDIRRVQQALRHPPCAPVLLNEVVGEGPNAIHVLSKLRRPGDDPPTTVEGLVAELAWSPLFHRVRLEDGTMRVRLLAEAPEPLRAFRDRLRRTFGDAFRIRLVNAGALQDGTPCVDHPLDPTDLSLLESALDMGYYEVPKRCRTGDLAEAMGLAKSTVSRRLRTLERRGLQALRRLQVPDLP